MAESSVIFSVDCIGKNERGEQGIGSRQRVIGIIYINIYIYIYIYSVYIYLWAPPLPPTSFFAYSFVSYTGSGLIWYAALDSRRNLAADCISQK